MIPLRGIGVKSCILHAMACKMQDLTPNVIGKPWARTLPVHHF